MALVAQIAHTNDNTGETIAVYLPTELKGLLHDHATSHHSRLTRGRKIQEYDQLVDDLERMINLRTTQISSEHTLA